MIGLLSYASNSAVPASRNVHTYEVEPARIPPIRRLSGCTNLKLCSLVTARVAARSDADGVVAAWKCSRWIWSVLRKRHCLIERRIATSRSDRVCRYFSNLRLLIRMFVAWVSCSIVKALLCGDAGKGRGRGSNVTLVSHIRCRRKNSVFVLFQGNVNRLSDRQWI